MAHRHKFIYMGQRDRAALVVGTKKAVEVRPELSSPAGDAVLERFKIVRYDWYLHIQGEELDWILWKGDLGISKTAYDDPEICRGDSQRSYPIRGGTAMEGNPIQGSFSPANDYISYEEKLVLCINPTFGVGRYALSLYALLLDVS